MEKGAYVKDIKEFQRVEGIFLTKDCRLLQSRRGDNFWSLRLLDATGALEAKIWHPLCESFAELPGGAFAHVSGFCKPYKDRPQLNIDKLDFLSQEEIDKLDISQFVHTNSRPPQEMFAGLLSLCETEFTHEPWRRLVFSVLNDDRIKPLLLRMPAARSVHHAYAGGLLEHTIGVFNLCRLLAGQYPQLDRQTLLAGALFHDIGKLREFTDDITTEYSQAGRLIGHMILGLNIIAPFIAQSGLEPHLAEHLEHLILSHHGEPEYGAARLPQTPEAFALHHADNVDAKLAQCRSSLENVNAPGFGAWESTLGRALFKPLPTPEQEPPRADARLQAPAPSQSQRSGDPRGAADQADEACFENYDEMDYCDAMPPEDVPWPQEDDMFLPPDADIPGGEADFAENMPWHAGGLEGCGPPGAEQTKSKPCENRQAAGQCSLL